MEMKERILQKADELFTKYGIKSITMDEIAAQLGISKKTIYLSFTDKNEMVAQVFDRHLSQSRAHCIQDKENAKDAVQEVLLGSEMFCNIMQSINPYVLYDLKKYHPDVFKKFTDFKNHFLFTCIWQNLKRGIKEELYRADIDLEIMTRLRLESVMVAMNFELFPSQKFRFTDVEHEAVNHFLYGIVTTKGARMMKKYNTRMTDINHIVTVS